VNGIKSWVRWGGLLAADATALVAWWPHWSQLSADLAAPHRWVDQVGTDQAALTLATAALWCVALWLAIGLAVLALATWPGRIGATAHRLAARLLPAVVLRAIAGVAGLGVLVAPIAPVAAGATTPPHPAPAASVVVPTPSWPTQPSGTGPHIGWPTDPAPEARPHRVEPPAKAHPRPQPADRHTDQAVRPPADQSVRPGDSLWLIAARRLSPGATDEQIAANWPRWYAANRAAIGDDPSLIRLGQVLHAPPPSDPAR